MANAWLEGAYSEIYPEVSRDEAGMCRLFLQIFQAAFPVTPLRRPPDQIHEGGELGYSLSRADGAAFDDPERIIACVVGDGEAETGPLATSWHSNKFYSAAQDGTVLPIRHFNGYKIANPTVLTRIGHDQLDALLRGFGHPPLSVDGADPPSCTSR